MDINVIRLKTILDGKEEILEDNQNFLDEINNELINDDLFLKEDVKDSPISVVFVETGGCERRFLPYFEKLSSPIILLSNGKNNSLAASFEIKTYCQTHGKLSLVVTGDEETCAKLLSRFLKVSLAKASLSNNNLGVIGEPSDWLISSHIDYQDIKDIFNMNMVDISMEELMNEINKKEMGSVPHLIDLKKKWKNNEVLDWALYIYGALKRLVKKYHLHGLTIRCFDLLGKYKNTSCLALALLNEEGITAACEGDVPSLLTMHVLKALTGRSSFQANPSYINQKDNTIVFAHCTLPLNMASKYELLTHFESNLGIGIKGEMATGPVTICKLFINEKHNLDNSIVVSGTIKDNLSLKGYCRTQIKVELSDFDMMTFLKESFGNHVLITYGEEVESLYFLITLYNYNR